MAAWNPWMLLGRVLRVPEDAEVEPAAATSIPLVAPPQTSVVTANPDVHPDPEFPDRYPYVLVANPVGLLVNFSSVPFYGVHFGVYPHEAHLVLLHRFHPIEAEAHVELGEMTVTATVVPLPPREYLDPIIFNLESIGMGMGLVTRKGVTTEEIIISELMVDRGSEVANIVYWCAGDHNRWHKKERANPLAALDRDWVPSGVVVHDERLWWFDLSWGILSCEVSPDHMGQLLFLGLPPGRTLHASRKGLHDHRCIAASGGALRYVEIIIPEEGEEGAAVVAMWTAIPAVNDNGQVTMTWFMTYEVSFATIWDDDSYEEIRLPRRVPVITAVSPWNSGMVFFGLQQEQRLFGVYVPEHTVLEFVDEAYDLVMPYPAPPSSRYVLAWLLDEQQQADDAAGWKRTPTMFAVMILRIGHHCLAAFCSETRFINGPPGVTESDEDDADDEATGDSSVGETVDSSVGETGVSSVEDT